MDKVKRQEILTLSWGIHDEVEQAIVHHTAVEGDDDWSEKQRLLIADMSLHLLQTALKPEPMCHEKLKNNLNAILTLSNDFVGEVDLKQVADALYSIEKA
ncbi:hypothetical protein N473_09725 [Pseudoalteromonas luteoviolacea CPMOR-1]|uniref:Uncharacterized protein n=2 Tax=Pseudoalteromonas luteoviolacea TaxID=43657 RepID=A0A023PYT3_9GAMM|nr:hypothetical protein [Pseudoalteromonas luteoviolacea]AHX39680.1 hypothetical protein [Pseudoalteromonas luteoviolacea]KID56774.1 hypothetical protein JF50_12765 [Pseudoalteromonas luteoviolacea]KZN66663.1 hypothetical protein N473_09725 [Pseudoalteromonas luteoviolacea CPMOR-1]